MIFSLIYDLGIPWILRKLRVKNKEISILMFHRICDEHDPLWPALPVKTFRTLIKELSFRACVVPLQDIDKISQYPDKPLVALSFDDGYLDFWENALGILADFRLPAHHNICPDLIDKGMPPWTQILNKFLQYNSGETFRLPNNKSYSPRKKINQSDFITICNELNAISNEQRDIWISSLLNRIPESKMTRLMSWEKLRECARLGIHIGSHGMSHLNMSKIEDNDILVLQINGSKTKIYKEIGVEPQIFAFPNGLYNPFSMEVVRKSGYKIALLCDDAPALFTGNNGKNFHIFTRINICRTNWKEEALRALGFHEKLKRLAIKFF